MCNRPLKVGRAIERPVVMHDHDAVAREPDVELEAVGAEGEPVLERRQRIFRRQRAAASMRKDERSGRLEKRMAH